MTDLKMLKKTSISEGHTSTNNSLYYNFTCVHTVHRWLHCEFYQAVICQTDVFLVWCRETGVSLNTLTTKELRIRGSATGSQFLKSSDKAQREIQYYIQYTRETGANQRTGRSKFRPFLPLSDSRNVKILDSDRVKQEQRNTVFS